MLKKFWIVTNDGKDTNHAVTEKVKELLEIAGRSCILCEKDAEKNKVMKIKEMTVFDVSITGHPKKYIKNSCCIRLEEI